MFFQISIDKRFSFRLISRIWRLYSRVWEACGFVWKLWVKSLEIKQGLSSPCAFRVGRHPDSMLSWLSRTRGCDGDPSTLESWLSLKVQEGPGIVLIPMLGSPGILMRKISRHQNWECLVWSLGKLKNKDLIVNEELIKYRFEVTLILFYSCVHGPGELSMTYTLE